MELIKLEELTKWNNRKSLIKRWAFSISTISKTQKMVTEVSPPVLLFTPLDMSKTRRLKKNLSSKRKRSSRWPTPYSRTKKAMHLEFRHLRGSSELDFRRFWKARKRSVLRSKYWILTWQLLLCMRWDSCNKKSHQAKRNSLKIYTLFLNAINNKIF